MAEQFDSSTEPETAPTNPDQRGRARRFLSQRSATRTPVALSTAVAKTPKSPRPGRSTAHPMRSFLTVTAVAGLVATVAIPAFAAGTGTPAEAVTLQQVAAENAQSLVVASEATPEALARDSYSATTPEEIQSKKDEEAAKAAAAARIAAAAASTASNFSATYSGAIALSIASSGSVVRPLTSFNSFGTPYAGHKGTDYMADRGTPIYAIADGVVVESAESSSGWGVYVKIAHNINGTTVTSLYAHMSYGTRRVTVGQSVTAGQLIGQVGDTGRAFGTHLHLEIYVSGSWVNPESWLQANVS
ncbi:M23 family metallopeptidase [Microbacterium memoriense]|uniref:Peptidoglycan DD-metalloendopeptidase family protein n=1 Tax=Microbacterium memoriense TaxID=2978350 RepID=A0ABT2PED1_9MICO|nr:peptidoglycan DD-metalloendopeptidase family protein [Microbacterium memoriense]MCT9002944.1 peptidoglycan DD-metalloendopeptidase family protein [Microbacterium memoriense]